MTSDASDNYPTATIVIDYSRDVAQFIDQHGSLLGEMTMQDLRGCYSTRWTITNFTVPTPRQ